LSKAIPPMACAVPVIYAGWGETSELIARERVGLTVEPGDPDEIALAITNLADDATLAKELGRRGRLLAEREFSWAFLVSDWLRQLELVLNGQNPGVPAPQSIQAAADRVCTP
jgi:glycosyltransferase involved in cell wall biosynthesis